MEAVVKHSCIFSVKAELDQLREGMEMFHLPSVMFTRHRQAFLPLCTHSVKPITAANLQDLFLMTFSLVGTNARDKQENSAMHWTSFLEEAEVGALCNSVEDRQFTVTLDILSFATGARHMPPMGFEIRPTIEFRSMQLPRASTCGNTLELPITETYEEFKSTMCFAISNTVGFGCI